MERVNAVIEEARICDVFDIWKRKPPALHFNETDALIVTAKTEDGKVISDTFYFCLKPNGTFEVATMNKDGTQARRRMLANFLKHYGLAPDIKGYNITEGIKNWKGKTIEVVSSDGGGYIFVPMGDGS